MRFPSPLHQYDALLAAGRIRADEAQLVAVDVLDRLWHRLRAADRPSPWRRFVRGNTAPVRGVYLWGGVGRGKTWLADLFFESLPIERKQRIHFHRFMQRVHAGLRQLEQVADPLAVLAADWARDCRVLCLDEFFVSDIADAMLLAGLLQGLFDRGVTLVTTSNIPPEELYRDGLQRAKFLPAIALLKRHLEVVHVEGDTDHRLRILEQSPVFHVPADSAADAALARSFEQMAAGTHLEPRLLVNDRMLQALRRADGVIWFTFDELCREPRSSIDYIELARAFNTVIVSGIAAMREEDADAARRFVVMVDEFYDRGVKLLASAAAPVEALYTGRRLHAEFQRATSRLIEMRTHDYLARPHRP